MKVLLIANHMNTGGVGLYIFNLAKHLLKNGIEVSILSAGGDLEESLAYNNIPHIKKDIKTKFEFGMKIWKAVPFLAKTLIKENFDIMHAHTRVAQVLCAVAGMLTGKPYVATCHGFFNYRRPMRRLLGCWGEMTIAISGEVRKHLLYDFKVKESHICHIRTGIELERFSSHLTDKDAFKKKLGINKDAFIIGCVARLSSVKGIDRLIGAFSVIKNKGYDAVLLLVGTGPDEDKLRKIVIENNITESVYFEHGDKYLLEDYFAAMDIFVMPSLMEGLGLALMEAMASGCPCIASKVGGIPEILEDGKDGLLVPPGDAAELTKAIEKLLKDPELRYKYSKAAKERALAQFSIEESMSKTIKLYKTVIGRSYR